MQGCWYVRSVPLPGYPKIGSISSMCGRNYRGGAYLTGARSGMKRSPRTSTSLDAIASYPLCHRTLLISGYLLVSKRDAWISFDACRPSILIGLHFSIKHACRIIQVSRKAV
jgi:hypothetical protein